MLKANGLDFEYHISVDGSRVQPATLALTWTRNGGFAGFCDQLIVFLSGEVYGSNCRSPQLEGTMKPFMDLLSANEQQQFFTWIQDFGQVSLDVSDPPTAADGMAVTLEFFGNGKGKPSEPDKEALMEFAQNLYQEFGAK